MQVETGEKKAEPGRREPKALPTDISGSRLLSVAQATGMLGISRSKLYGMMRHSKNPPPSVLLQKSRKFPLDKLRWWMENLGQ